MYEIFKVNLKFKRNFKLEELITKMTIKNPY